MMAGDTLQRALDQHGMHFPEEQVARLQQYCQLLWRWNSRLNLTRHTTYEKFASRDLLDSIQLSRLLESDEEVLDVGTGGGVPGIVLAIVRPDLSISLSESVKKKARAVESIIVDLDLPVAVYPDRAENVLEDLRFDTLVARAVGPLWKMCKWFQPHWHAFGRLLATKGPRWTDERQEARARGLLNGVQLRRAASYPMPGTHSESVILELQAKRNAGA
jgi:16S rRNA (guanine527-N7)-methyltransferase